MSTNPSQEADLGQQLWDLGWRQGSLFTAPSATFVYNAFASGATELTQQPRRVRNREKLVLISQDCDIVADVRTEPYVEALICTVEQPKFTAMIVNSARWFLVDPEAHLVAHARYRVQLDKRALLQPRPQEWPSDDKRFERFVRWLAWRYDRPALPDDIVAAFTGRVDPAFRSLNDQHPEVVRAFSRAVHEIRISMPSEAQPPYRLEMVFLVRRGELTEEEAGALKLVGGVIWGSVDATVVNLVGQPTIRNAEEISLADYLATRPIFLEHYTLEGEEYGEAEPYPRG